MQKYNNWLWNYWSWALYLTGQEPYPEIQDMACEKCEQAAREFRKDCYACYLLERLDVGQKLYIVQSDRIQSLKASLQLIADGPPCMAREIARTALARDVA